MECRVCHAEAVNIKRCARCHHALYCSTKCQKDDWPEHRFKCPSVEKPTRHKTYTMHYYGQRGRGITEDVSTNIYEGDTLIHIKCSGTKTNLKLCKQWDGALIFKLISQQSRVPLGDMKVIVKGKVVLPDDITNYIAPKALFMVLGHKVESSDGLDERDIECLMSQMKLDRNSAIGSLRKCGSLLDAMLDVGK